MDPPPLEQASKQSDVAPSARNPDDAVLPIGSS
jgi:hypothetical protein